MHLYLLRHGHAEPYRSDDAGRALTAIGRVEIERVARAFADKGITLDACFHSPYLRTTQTCELFLRVAAQSVAPVPAVWLMPNHRASESLGYLRSLQQSHVLLVTHNPLVSELYAVLTGADTDRMHVFATGELDALDCDVCVTGGASAVFRLEP